MMLSMIGVAEVVCHSAVTRSVSELLVAEPKVAPSTAPEGSVVCASAPFFVQLYRCSAVRLFGGAATSSWMYSCVTRPAASSPYQVSCSSVKSLLLVAALEHMAGLDVG